MQAETKQVQTKSAFQHWVAAAVSIALPLFLSLPPQFAVADPPPPPPSNDPQSVYRFKRAETEVCSWQLGVLGKSPNPELVATHGSFSGAVIVSEDGNVLRVDALAAAKMVAAPSTARKGNGQKLLQFDGADIQLQSGEKITATGFGIGEGGEGRLIVGTSKGRLIIVNPGEGTNGQTNQVIAIQDRANDGQGPIRKISISQDGSGFIVLRGDRASAHVSEDGQPQWFFQEQNGMGPRTHLGGVTDVALSQSVSPNVFVTVGKDGVGRVFAGIADGKKVRDRAFEFPLRLVRSGSGSVSSNAPPIAKVAVSSTHSKSESVPKEERGRRLIVIADENGAVKLFDKHLSVDRSDKKKPTLLQAGGSPVRVLSFSESETVPKLLVANENGTADLYRFNMSKSSTEKYAFSTREPITASAWIDNDTLLVGTKNGEIFKVNVREPQQPRILAHFPGPTGAVDTLTIVESGAAFISSSADGTIRAGPVNPGEEKPNSSPKVQIDTRKHPVRQPRR